MHSFGSPASTSPPSNGKLHLTIHLGKCGGLPRMRLCHLSPAKVSQNTLRCKSQYSSSNLHAAGSISTARHKNASVKEIFETYIGLSTRIRITVSVIFSSSCELAHTYRNLGPKACETPCYISPSRHPHSFGVLAQNENRLYGRKACMTKDIIER